MRISDWSSDVCSSDLLYGIDDLKDVQASATDGAATIQAEFDWSSSAERKYEEVVREVTALRPTLPDGVTRLDVVRNRTSETAIFQAAPIGRASCRERVCQYV